MFSDTAHRQTQSWLWQSYTASNALGSSFITGARARPGSTYSEYSFKYVLCYLLQTFSRIELASPRGKEIALGNDIMLRPGGDVKIRFQI